MTNAICTLIFGNVTYLVGACISFYVHKKFIEKNNYDIKLVVLVDNLIYKYKDILEIFFDKIVLIDINKNIIKLDYNKIKNEKGVSKYINWIKYSLNKWEIFNLESYDKILFTDTDVLPININFYNIFNNKTPSVLINKLYENNIKINPDTISDKKIFLNSDYNSDKYLKNSINASLLLITPDKKIFDEYRKFIKICEGNNGYQSSHPDETSLLYFLMYYKKIELFSISKYYASMLKEYDKNKSCGLDYPSKIKPWEKLPMLQWSEENIWHIIAKKVMIKSEILTKIYIQLILERLIFFAKNYKNITKNYNLECIKDKNIYKKTIKLLDFINNLKTFDEINTKYIFKQAKQIHKLMNKKSLTNIDYVINVI